MVPTWVLSTLIVIAGCIAACYIGSSLPMYDYFGWYIVLVAIVCTIGAITNDFPMLLAVGTWMPFVIPVGAFSNFPTIILVLGWMCFILFFRLCLSGTLPYVKSFNLFFLVVFFWVVIRFVMNPVRKLGGGVEGGAGVSGATPYANYVIAAGILIAMGAILNSREKVLHYMMWCFRLVFVIGVGFLICAFIPSTAGFLYRWGVFAAGNMGDGILRLVQLPAYGFFFIQCALCPHLFKLNRIWCWALVGLGVAMMIVGGNRSTILAAVVSIPVILILRRSTHVLILLTAVLIVAVGMLRLSVSQMGAGEISPMARSLSVFDSSIDKASGGDLSSQWRYMVWESGIKKIMEDPLIGKGFGNLPKHLDPNSAEVAQSTDFEVILAGGEAHNGFITAAYGFGIPFMVLITFGLLMRFAWNIRAALMVDKHDKEMRDLYALLASMFPAYFINIYAAFDMSVAALWIYVGLGFILQNLPKPVAARESSPTTAQPSEAYMYPSRY